MGLRIIRSLNDRFPKLGGCLGVLTGLAQYDAELPVGTRVLCIEFNRLPEVSLPRN